MKHLRNYNRPATIPHFPGSPAETLSPKHVWAQEKVPNWSERHLQKLRPSPDSELEQEPGAGQGESFHTEEGPRLEIFTSADDPRRHLWHCLLPKGPRHSIPHIGSVWRATGSGTGFKRNWNKEPFSADFLTHSSTWAIQFQSEKHSHFYCILKLDHMIAAIYEMEKRKYWKYKM